MRVLDYQTPNKAARRKRRLTWAYIFLPGFILLITAKALIPRDVVIGGPGWAAQQAQLDARIARANGLARILHRC